MMMMMTTMGTEPSSSSPLILTREEAAISLKRQPLHLSQAHLLHSHIIFSGLLHHDIYIANLLIGMYRNCGSSEHAKLVFERMPERSVVSWTVMMSACIRKDKIHSHEAFHVYEEMKRQGFIPNRVTLLTLLKACVDETTWIYGKMIHDHVVSCDLYYGDLSLATSLVNMYGRCGDVQNARLVFNQMSRHNSSDHVLWTTMISVYSQCGLVDESLSLFRKMLLEEGITPTEVTFVAALGACVNPMYLEDGKFIHMNVSSMGFESNVIVATALVSMYGKCGDPHLARSAYDKILNPDIIASTSMIVVYANYGYGAEAFHLFENLVVEPNEVTLIGVLGACSDMSKGLLIHRYVIENGFGSNIILSTALMNMYGRCGSLHNAYVVFNKIQPCDIICWNSMVGVHSQYGNSSQAIKLLQEMQQEGIKPDKFTFISLLASCTGPAALADGIFIHENLKANELMEKDVVICNALVNMYAKCGVWEKAYSVFVTMDEHNLMSWNAIITGCCQHGHAKDGLKLFESMQKEGIKPDEVTYLCLLNACSHAGLVDECYNCFLSMLEDANLKPWIEHLTCIVGLLGRSGRLDDAENVIHKARFELDSVIWVTLLSACREHGDVERAKRIASAILKLNPKHDAACVLLANTYSVDGQGVDVEKIEQTMIWQ